MLDPSDRTLLLESLRPPDGYTLDRAVGTTYSLDLLALLTTPLAFTFFEWEDDTGAVTADPVKLLQAVRGCARRITLFCQAGEIHLPPADQRLTAYLEDSVVEVRAPNGGVFHPKVWVLRFINASGPVRYRFICASRNLTFDRCWDGLVVLDGEVAKRQRAIAANHPLADFLAALPAMAVRSVESTVAEAIAQMADEVRRVVWELPEPIEELQFHPMGLSARKQSPIDPELNRRPILVISPFVRDSQLQKLAESSSQAILVSRTDELARLRAETLGCFSKVYAFEPDLEEEESEQTSTDIGLTGLHAKLFVVDNGWRSHIWLGSANATNAAFASNVEFLVEMVGAKSRVGIDALLTPAEGKQVTLLSLLKAWSPPVREPDPSSEALRALEAHADELCHDLGVCGFNGNVSGLADGRFALKFTSSQPLPASTGMALRCWPTTLRADWGLEVEGGKQLAARFEPLTLDALTGFLAFELLLSEGEHSVRRSFVCSVGVTGLPADRMDRLLASVLADEDRLMRLIWILLESQGFQASDLGGSPDPSGQFGWRSAPVEGYPLLERLLATAASEPQRVAEMGRLIEDLQKTPEGSKVVPAKLLTLWAALKSLQTAEASTAVQ